MNKEIEGEFVSNTCSLFIYSASAILRFELLFSGRIVLLSYCRIVVSLSSCRIAFTSQYKPKSSSTAIGVYKIKCKECSKVYIGETSRSFKLRIAEHKNNCKRYITGNQQ